jgi:hypothetical protein
MARTFGKYQKTGSGSCCTNIKWLVEDATNVNNYEMNTLNSYERDKLSDGDNLRDLSYEELVAAVSTDGLNILLLCLQEMDLLALTALAMVLILLLLFLYDSHGPFHYYSCFVFFSVITSLTAVICLPINLIRPVTVKYPL